MFGLFNMSEEQKAMLATKNLISFRNMNDKQIRKYSSTPITSTKVSFTTQKIVLLLDAMFKVASFSKDFTYKDISTNKKLYEVIGNYFNQILQNENHFPPYEKFQEHNDLVIQELFKRLIDPNDNFRNDIQN